MTYQADSAYPWVLLNFDNWFNLKKLASVFPRECAKSIKEGPGARNTGCLRANTIEDETLGFILGSSILDPLKRTDNANLQIYLGDPTYLMRRRDWWPKLMALNLCKADYFQFLPSDP